MEFDNLYDKCINLYSHEGEIDFGDVNLTFFRRCSYEDFDHLDEDGNPKWIEGDEAVGVFINKEEFLGWYEGDCIENMKDAAEDALREIIRNHNVTMTVEVSHTFYDSDLSYSSVKEAKEAIKKKLAEDLCITEDKITNFKCKRIKLDDEDEKFEVSCKAKLTDPETIIYICKEGELYYGSETVKISDADPNKDTFENYFEFRVDIL